MAWNKKFDFLCSMQKVRFDSVVKNYVYILYFPRIIQTNKYIDKIKYKSQSQSNTKTQLWLNHPLKTTFWSGLHSFIVLRLLRYSSFEKTYEYFLKLPSSYNLQLSLVQNAPILRMSCSKIPLQVLLSLFSC